MNTEKTLNVNGNTRQRWFRRAGVLATVAALAGGVGWQAHAHAHGGPGFGHGFLGGIMRGAPSDERIERMMKHFFVEINATPEQQQRLTPIVKQAASDLQPLREQVRSTRKQAATLFTAETIDRGAIENVRAQRLQMADAVSRRLSQAFADVAEVLTPAQRKALAERMQKRHGGGHRPEGRRG
ncbi:MAG TPA: Spy/CpxP family protein refolding chaperone [Burkholderiales bacterium]|nr:Spy/CpxP family protein refolding chaperone [Burkholderiales bacterium]